MFDMDCFARLRKRGGDIVVFDQYVYGAPSTRPTQILYHGATFHQLESSCDHEPVRLRDKHGKVYYASHPSVVQQQSPDGSYRTKTLAAYPPELNWQLARIMAEALFDRG